jgi:hypothetical protein
MTILDAAKNKKVFASVGNLFLVTSTCGLVGLLAELPGCPLGN